MNARQIAAVVAALLGIAVILAAVGGPSAFASYHHAYQVFVTYGETEGRAAWLPLTTDGMLAAALVVMYSRRWAKQPIGGIPWLAFAVGFTGTIAANLASARVFGTTDVGEIIGRLAAAVWSPIVFAVTLELVAVMLGKVRDYVARSRAESVSTWPSTWQVGIPVYPYSPPSPEPAPVSAPGDPVAEWLRSPSAETAAAAAAVLAAPALAAPAPRARTRKPRPSAPAQPSAPAVPAPEPAANGHASRWTDADELVRMELQTECDESGTPPSLRSVKERYGMGQDRARKILARVQATSTDTEPVR